jgi:hypothetical protein
MHSTFVTPQPLTSPCKAALVLEHACTSLHCSRHQLTSAACCTMLHRELEGHTAAHVRVGALKAVHMSDLLQQCWAAH